MRVVVDHERCEGHGRCFAVAPSVYDVDDDGYSTVDSVTVAAGMEEAAREGAAACPRQAIAVIE
ncbi:ferredoxin [Mycobacterium alsense]|uniref:Ferredoxin n=1 Tax=Mycobacterium alsense TaxID=324058 RepID=A0ABD6NU28_9MYCO|nr:ferredoxin [Mycobacterium alsense]OBG28478.1 ferredoxin [Mycobacterium alsense]OBI99718.1 ferredoxin [Mycobacterium alsense]